MQTVYLVSLGWYYNVAIGIATLIIALLAFAGDLEKEIKFSHFNKLLFKIPVTIVASGLIIWATINKDNEADEKAEEGKKEYQTALDNKQQELDKALKFRDSVNQVKLVERDSLNSKRILAIQEDNKQILIKSNNGNLKTYTQVLANYNLQLDEANKKIIKMVRDSSHQLSDVPYLRLCIDKGVNSLIIKSDSVFFKMKLCNDSDFPSYNLSYSLLVFDIVNGKPMLVMANKSNDIDALGNRTFRTFEYEAQVKNYITDTVAFVLKGRYENSYGRVLNLISSLLYSTRKDDRLGMPSKIEQSILNVIKNIE